VDTTAPPDDSPIIDTQDSGGDTEPPIDTCAELDLPIEDFAEAAGDDSLYATAPDFTLQVSDLDGVVSDWTLSEQWSGCETYLLISHGTGQLSSYDNYMDNHIFEEGMLELLEAAPDNARIFLLSDERDDEDRAEALAIAQASVLAALEEMSDEDQRWWRPRVHLVQERDRYVEGWVGDHFSGIDWGIGIDRLQRIRYIGSYADPDQYSSAIGWFLPNLKFPAYEAIFYNFEYDREQTLAAQDAIEVAVFDDEVLSDSGWAGVRGYAEVQLPAAEELAGYDSMAFDLYLGCNGSGEYGTCPAWDYLVYLYQHSSDLAANPYAKTACVASKAQTIAGVCTYPDGHEVEASYSCNHEGSGYDDLSCPSREIGRWITTYHREGRWVHDVSGLLPLLGEGGTQQWSFYTQQEYVVDLDVRLYNAGKQARPAETTAMFTGGSLNESYNDRDPITLAIPEDATKVELATVISGHGQVGLYNCAEFCETTHHFTVNGQHENVIALSNAGTATGCQDMVDQGVVPNQYGTWWYGRSGWCPGWEVPVEVTDITDQVVPGEDNLFEYAGYFNGGDFTQSGANIILSSYLVVSR